MKKSIEVGARVLTKGYKKGYGKKHFKWRKIFKKNNLADLSVV